MNEQITVHVNLKQNYILKYGKLVTMLYCIFYIQVSKCWKHLSEFKLTLTKYKTILAKVVIYKLIDIIYLDIFIIYVLKKKKYTML